MKTTYLVVINWRNCRDVHLAEAIHLLIKLKPSEIKYLNSTNGKA